MAVLWRGVSDKGPDDLRVATTGLEAIPNLHIDESECAVKTWNGDSSVFELAESIRKAVKPVKITWFSPPYRRKMVKVLTKRACRGLLVS